MLGTEHLGESSLLWVLAIAGSAIASVRAAEMLLHHARVVRDRALLRTLTRVSPAAPSSTGRHGPESSTAVAPGAGPHAASTPDTDSESPQT